MGLIEPIKLLYHFESDQDDFWLIQPEVILI